MEKLIIYNPSGTILIKVAKWEFSDTYMGEQCITFNIDSEKPVEWSVGCYCIYRGERYNLNYIPGVTQRARKYETGNAFTYDSVKFESVAEELTRIVMLDITASTGDYVESLGTNYTGSSHFQLFCGETTVGDITRTAVCTLAGKIYANIIRANADWHIYVDTTSTHEVNGVPVLNTHTDDKVLSFNNTTVREALEMVHSEFDLDFAVSGRNIYIGYSLGHLTDIGNEEHDYYYFGYGRGMAGIDNEGKSLYEIKKTADNNQKIITRLRALGSQKNLPYRYYNKKYNLSQALFPANLQLPDTFASLEVKQANNAMRREIYSDIRDVLGQTNDAYIDKDDDAPSTPEGIREHSAMWDGSDQELEEIYPTIKEATYGELRAANCADMDDTYNTEGLPDKRPGASAFPNYTNTERIDEIADFDYRTNLGDGYLAENTTDSQGIETRELSDEQQQEHTATDPTAFYVENGGLKTHYTLFSLPEQPVGSYILSPALGRVYFEASLSTVGRTCSAKVGYHIFITDPEGNSLLCRNGAVVPYFESKPSTVSYPSGPSSVEVLAIPDVKNGDDASVTEILISEPTAIVVSYAPYVRDAMQDGSRWVPFPSGATLTFRIGLNSEQREEKNPKVKSSFVWRMRDTASTYMNTPFCLYLKDLGMQEMVSCFNTSDTPVIAMTSGACVGREFQIATDSPEKVTIGGRRYWKVQCTRASDQSLQTYYPSASDPITVGDTFVLLNVSMPEPFIKAAEVRLLVAASAYLKNNCNTRYVYEPHIDDIFLQRDYDKWLKGGAPERSIYWQLYAGLKFPFFGIPEYEDQRPEDVLVDVTIQKIVIKEGEGDTPKVEITLNDEITTSTIKKLTTAVDRIYSGSLFSQQTGSAADVSAIRTIVRQYGRSLFLSKEMPDTAEGKITFNDGADFGRVNPSTGTAPASVTSDGDAEFHSIVTDTEESNDTHNPESMLGNGYLRKTDEGGRSYVYTDFLTVRMKMSAAELEIRKISYTGGNRVASPAGSTIEFAKEIFNRSSSYRSGWRCYIKADDGTDRTSNEWRIGDQARCQTFNLGESASNRYYWRLVVNTGQVYVLVDENGNPTYEESHNPNDARRLYNFVDLSDINSMHFSEIGRGRLYLNDDGVTQILTFFGKDPMSVDAPEGGDVIVCMGSQWLPKFRGNIIMESTADENAPSYTMYHGVGNGTSAATCYTLSRHMTAMISPEQWYVNAERFKWTHDGVDDSTPPNIERGNYDPNATYFSGDIVNYNGARWQCITTNPEGVRGIAPSEGEHWTCLVSSPYKIEVIPEGGANIIRNGQGEITLRAYAYRGTLDITDELFDDNFNWTRDSGNADDDEAWNEAHEGAGSSIVVTADEVNKSAIFQCILVGELGGIINDPVPVGDVYGSGLYDADGYEILTTIVTN